MEVQAARSGEAVAPAATLPLTGSRTTGPLTLAVGLLLAGAAAIGLAGRRRLASASVHAKTVELPVALGRLLSGRHSE